MYTLQWDTIQKHVHTWGGSNTCICTVGTCRISSNTCNASMLCVLGVYSRAVESRPHTVACVSGISGAFLYWMSLAPAARPFRLVSLMETAVCSSIQIGVLLRGVPHSSCSHHEIKVSIQGAPKGCPLFSCFHIEGTTYLG